MLKDRIWSDKQPSKSHVNSSTAIEPKAASKSFTRRAHKEHSATVQNFFDAKKRVSKSKETKVNSFLYSQYKQQTEKQKEIAVRLIEAKRERNFQQHLEAGNDRKFAAFQKRYVGSIIKKPERRVSTTVPGAREKPADRIISETPVNCYTTSPQPQIKKPRV